MCVGVRVGGSGVGAAARTRSRQDEFFDRPMYLVDVRGWPADQMHPDKGAVVAPAGARLRLWETDPSSGRHLPPPRAAEVLLDTGRFSLANSGNRTLMAPKRSWKVDLDVDDADGEVGGMKVLNLKSMYNDPSQMREALAWRLFRQAGVPASRHTYAKLGINGTYLGLHSVIEQVDRAFLKDRFGHNSKGNLYKVYCGEIGPGTLEHRVGPDGDDSGQQYRGVPGGDDRTYRLKSYSDAPDAETYDDLARFVRVVNGVGMPAGDGGFDTDTFAASVRDVFDVDAFLRWAGINVLIGAWDNYFATPANYYLYNSGKVGGADDAVADPYFTFIPWDYDNTFGIDYFGVRWQDTDLLDWVSNTVGYWRFNGGHGTSRLPLVQNVLRNTEFRRYYLDHVEYLLDSVFNPAAIEAVTGADGSGGLWARVSQAAYLESDTPYGRPFTQRQWTNDEVFRNGFAQYELRHGNAFVLGITHYVRMRHDSARAQLARMRAADPRGSSGASFPAPPEPLPALP
jgi:CotH kinase protein